MIGYRIALAIIFVVLLSTVSIDQNFARADNPPILNVIKFYDTNANGQFDPGVDQLITNWRITVNGVTQYTSFLNIYSPGTVVTVTESDPIEKNWYATTPKSFTNTMVANQLTNIAFGNLCVGKGNGHNSGFWANQNGFAVINDGNEVDSELLLLQNLNLKDGAGADFDPTTYDQLRTWLLGANGSNMSYILSAQLAAMVLNVESGDVSGSSYLKVSGLTSTGYISISELIDRANKSLSAGDPKEIQEPLKSALEQGNNGQNYVQPTACPFTFKKSSK